jgi:hypothetical protein
MYKKILHEIQKQLEQRGEVTKEQRDYARVELEQMEKISINKALGRNKTFQF